MRKRFKISKKHLVRFSIILFLIIFIVAIIIDSRKEQSYIIPDFTYKNVDYKKKDNIDLLFFAGIDIFDREYSESYRNNYHADTIIVFVLDKANKTITPIHINSEILCEYNLIDDTGKIIGRDFGLAYMSHTYGLGGMDSLVNTKDTIRDLLTGISMEYYFSMTMDGVPVVNDALGYVDVYVEDDFSKVDPTLIQYEINTLKGYQSLMFIRQRLDMPDTSNISRMNRQKVYYDALFHKAKDVSSKDEDFIAETYKKVDKYIVSNTDMYKFIDLCNVFIDYDLQDPVAIEGTYTVLKDGTSGYIVDEEEVIKLCIEYFYDRIS